MGTSQSMDKSSADALNRHLRAIGRIPLLNAAEEISLARRVQRGRALEAIAEELEMRAGGKAPSLEAWALEAGLSPQELRRQLNAAARAKQRMVTANLRLVVSVAKRYANRFLELEDVIQEGNMGLIKAVDRYDPTRGYKFSTYAFWWIRESITRGLAKRGRAIRLPAHMIEMLNRLRKSQQMLYQDLGRQPSLEELAEATGFKLLDVREALFRAQPPVSLDASSGENGDQQLIDQLASDLESPDERTHQEQLRIDVHRTLEQLPEDQQKLLKLRYGINNQEPMTLSAIARTMGITRDSARGVERRATRLILEQAAHTRLYLAS